jgi:hypothetical protein
VFKEVLELVLNKVNHNVYYNVNNQYLFNDFLQKCAVDLSGPKLETCKSIG